MSARFGIGPGSLDGGRHDQSWPGLPPDDRQPMLVLQEVDERCLAQWTASSPR